MGHKQTKEMYTKLRDHLKETVAHFANETTLHGVKNTFVSKSSLWNRCMWLVILVGMVTFSAIMITQSILNFLNYDTITIVRQTVHDNLPLPYISFCNFNFPRKHLLLERYPDIEEFKDLYEEYLVRQVHSDHSIDNEYNEARTNITDRLRNVTMHDYYWDVGYSIDEAIVSCMFAIDGVSFDCHSYITQFRNSIYGLCHTFDSGEIAQEGNIITETGYSGGVTIVLNVFPGEYSFESTGPTTGYAVFIHDSEYPDLGDPVAVSTGSHSFIGLKKEKQSILPKPYADSNCLDTSERKYKHYNRLACLERCNDVAEWTSQPNCTCDISVVEGERACTLYDLLFCVWPYHSNNVVNSLAASSQSDHCHCPHPCDDVYYDKTVSTVSLASPYLSYRAQLENWAYQNATDMEEYYASFQVYFRSFTETHTLEKPAMKMNDVFANIGGQVGLCVGASMITIVEFLELCMILLYTMLRFLCKRFHKSEVAPTKQAFQNGE